MTRRSLAVVALLALAALSGAAFAYRSWAARARDGGTAEQGTVSASASAPSIPGTATAPTVPPATARARKVVPLTVYFPNRRYVETGDESLPRVVAEHHNLEVADVDGGVDPLARALLSALQAGPKTAAAAPAIPERLVIRSVHVREDVAYVDFAKAGLSGGSLEETLLVRSIVRTLTGVAPVRAVQFLVDGAAPETLMGHVTTTKPIAVVD